MLLCKVNCDSKQFSGSSKTPACVSTLLLRGILHDYSRREGKSHIGNQILGLEVVYIHNQLARICHAAPPSCKGTEKCTFLCIHKRKRIRYCKPQNSFNNLKHMDMDMMVFSVYSVSLGVSCYIATTSIYNFFLNLS